MLTRKAPFFIRAPQSLIASVGESATFSVRAFGSLPLSYQWMKNGAVISGAIKVDNFSSLK